MEYLQVKLEVIAKIEKLIANPSYLYALSLILRHDLTVFPDELPDINWEERLSFQELSFLIGLMVKRKFIVECKIEKDIIYPLIENTYKLLREYHDVCNKPSIDDLKKMYAEVKKGNKPKENLPDNKLNWDLSEPIFYGDSGAYDFQFLRFAKERYTIDNRWLKNNRGIEIEQIVDIAFLLQKIQVLRINAEFNHINFKDRCIKTFNSFCFCENELNIYNSGLVKSFLDNFSILPGEVNKEYRLPGQYNIIDSHPIINMSDGNYFLPVWFNLASSIYESPFYWMLEDNNYRDTSFQNRGAATVNIAFNLLKEVFGESNTKAGVKIYKGNNIISDIDILTYKGNKAIAIQVKSKKLTELSKRGNIKILKDDFKKAVQSAYSQGIKSRNAILEKEHYLKDEVGNKIILDERIDDVYIICLTSDDYPAVYFQTNLFLEKDKNEPYPIVMNIFDLDIMTFYLNDSFELLYYLRQRIDYYDYFKGESEIGFLGYHLNQKLFPIPSADMVFIAREFAQLIDGNYPALQGYMPKTESIKKLRTKWTNKKFNEIVNQVKRTSDPSFTDAVFFLYDLAGQGADDLIKHIESTIEKAKNDGKNHDFSLCFQRNNRGVSYIYQNENQVTPKLLKLCVARKYKSKADIWLGLGSVAKSDNLVDSVVFCKDKWQPNEELEKYSQVALKPGTLMVNKRIKVGRNDPCSCGSGMKYKKCCGRK